MHEKNHKHPMAKFVETKLCKELKSPMPNG